MENRVPIRKHSKTKTLVCISVYFFISLFIFGFEIAKSEKISTESDLNNNQYHEAILADFEQGIPCSHEGNIIGFRKKDRMRALTVEEGVEGTKRSALFRLLSSEKDLFFHGEVKIFLLTKPVDILFRLFS